MNRGLTAAIACCLVVSAAGCGSSSSSSGATSSGSTTTATTAASATATAAKGSTSPGATLKVDTTPKFAAPSPSTPVQSGQVQIAYRNIAIAPDTVRVKVGSTIKWTNYDSVQANVTSEGGVGGPYKFASKNFGEGGTFELKVEKPGVIHYESTQYPTTMNGTIEVVS